MPDIVMRLRDGSQFTSPLMRDADADAPGGDTRVAGYRVVAQAG